MYANTKPRRLSEPPRRLNRRGSDAVTPKPLAQFSQPHGYEIGIFVRHDSSTEPIEISSGLSEGLNG